MQITPRVHFSTSTTLTSDLAIGSPERSSTLGDRLTPAESGLTNGMFVMYWIVEGSTFAYGIGTYSSSGPTIVRDANEKNWNGTVLSTGKLSLGGNAKVFLDYVPGAFLARPLVLSEATATTVTLNVDNQEVYKVTALASNITVANPTGTPYDGQKIRYEFKDNGTTRTITWGTAFGGGVIPSTTGATTVYMNWVEFRWDAARAKWVMRGYADEAAVYDTPSYIGGKTATAASVGANQSVTLNSGLTGGVGGALAEGDIVIVAVAKASTTDLTLDVTGYNKVADLYYGAATYDANFGLFWKPMGSSPDTSLTVVGNTSTGASIIVMVWRGCDVVTLDATTTTVTGAGTTAFNPPAITPSTAGNIIISGGCFAAEYDVTVTPASSDLSNFQNVKYQITSVNSATAVLGSKSGTAAAASFDPASFTGFPKDSSRSWAAATMALKPRSLN